jgi:hypothetical protein
VRSGVLESLGEVVYVFHLDPDGLPQELLRLFLGHGVSRTALGRNEDGHGTGEGDGARLRTRGELAIFARGAVYPGST